MQCFINTIIKNTHNIEWEANPSEMESIKHEGNRSMLFSSLWQKILVPQETCKSYLSLLHGKKLFGSKIPAFLSP